ncbi:MAG: rRNA methylase [Planctomycetota bacterium]|nr:MAG: rRNA methylase [Planctomycetota bacterium]
MPLIPVQTLDDPRLTVFRDVKATRHSRWAGRFVAEGARLVKRLLSSDFVVESLMLTEGRVEEFSSWLRPEIPTFVMPQTLAAELVGYNFHCGAMACALRKPSPSLDDIMARGGERMTFVVCPDVNDPENIGTLIRLGAAFGIDAMLLGPACADPFSRRVLRVSMGNALTLPIVCSQDLNADLLASGSERRSAHEPDASAFRRIEPLGQARRPARLALLFGNEANGLGSEWLELCDRRLTIPMQGADSLNVAISAGIFLHHFTASAPVPSVSRP